MKPLRVGEITRRFYNKGIFMSATALVSYTLAMISTFAFLISLYGGN
jgi:hypothetical protein